MDSLRQLLRKIDKSRFLEKFLISIIHSLPFLEKKLFEIAAYSGKYKKIKLNSHAQDIFEKLKKGGK